MHFAPFIGDASKSQFYFVEILKIWLLFCLKKNAMKTQLQSHVTAGLLSRQLHRIYA